MIQETLKFLADEVNKYLSLKIPGIINDAVVLGNVSTAADKSDMTTSLTDHALLSLVNIEEDIFKKMTPGIRTTGQGLQVTEQPVHLNLYILFTVSKTSYSDSLTWLQHIVQFFRDHPVFTPSSHPGLDKRVENLVADLYPLNFEQMNNLWSIMGGKHLPSVLYKIRQTTAGSKDEARVNNDLQNIVNR